MVPSMNTTAKGARVRLISTTDEFTRLREGDEGTVEYVDDIDTIHVKWDNGANLGLVPGEDRFVVL